MPIICHIFDDINWKYGRVMAFCGANHQRSDLDPTVILSSLIVRAVHQRRKARGKIPPFDVLKGLPWEVLSWCWPLKWGGLVTHQRRQRPVDGTFGPMSVVDNRVNSGPKWRGESRGNAL